VSRLSQEIQDAWISFARSGRPGHPGPGDWPTYEATRRATLVLGEQTRIEHAPLETERALWADLEG
jgi:para-nitrobenzyl esterase